MEKDFTISGIIPANETLLMQDVFLILIDTLKIPPHLAVSVNGKLFTLTINGATVEGELAVLLRHLRRKQTPTLFVRLILPSLFTMAQLRKEITRTMLHYPRVDIGIATCLSPIKDFCTSIYHTENENVNFVYQLIPDLENKAATNGVYHMHMDGLLNNQSFALKKYSMNDIFEGIRVAHNQLV